MSGPGRDLPPLLVAARAALAAGLSPIPAAADGTKAPRPDGPRWQPYQTRRPTIEELDGWFGDNRYDGLGLVCGAVSGHLELLEFEGVAVTDGTLEAFLMVASAVGLGDLVERVRRGYEETTPTGGLHWLYRIGFPADESVCEHVGNQKLARRRIDDRALQVLLETRGEGGFVVVAPSTGRTHPTGRPWTLTRGGFDTIATVTVAERRELHRVARTLDEIGLEPQ